MKIKYILISIVIIVICFIAIFYKNIASNFSLNLSGSEILSKVTDSASDKCGYSDSKGNMVIPIMYDMCFSSSLDKYAFVSDGKKVFAISRENKLLYYAYMFENGPDYESEGLFRMAVNGKIGYANAKTGDIVIRPEFECADSFVGGVAKVALSCSKKKELSGEHTFWVSTNTIYINSIGKIIEKYMKINKILMSFSPGFSGQPYKNFEISTTGDFTKKSHPSVDTDKVSEITISGTIASEDLITFKELTRDFFTDKSTQTQFECQKTDHPMNIIEVHYLDEKDVETVKKFSVGCIDQKLAGEFGNPPNEVVDFKKLYDKLEDIINRNSRK